MKIKDIMNGQLILPANSAGNLVSLLMRSFCQSVDAAIAAGIMNWKNADDAIN